MQEAYRPPCSEYSFCCPTWVPPRGGTQSPPGGTQSGTPPGGYPDPPRGVPGGVPGQVPPSLGGYLDPPPPGGGYPDPPSPPVDRQTPVKTVPSRRTTYAGGNKAEELH